ncbi:MAG: response regulator transcription factor [Spirochaetales bacterium]|jgi:DNA-binding NarL/FixJ family response regulator|nr:response regulator transcription factor [Spirochaetales bacterium]
MIRSVFLVEDHPIVRQGFVQLIEQENDLKVIGEAEDAATALQLITHTSPDIALVDLSLKNSNGIELIKDLNKQCPKVPILVVSLHDENLYAERCLRAGARGFIMKTEATDNVMTAIRLVLSGEIYLSPAMRNRMLSRFTTRGDVDRDSVLESLSDREFEVFQLMGKGQKTRIIADKLNLSVKTIETYKAHLKTKLNLEDATGLIQVAIEWNLKKQFYGDENMKKL